MIVLTALIFTLDVVFPQGQTSVMLFVGVVGVSMWLPERRHIYITAAACSIIGIIAHFISEPGLVWIDAINRSFSVLAIWMTALICGLFKQTRETYRHLASIVESSEDAIFSKDLNGTILSWNNGAERNFGYSAQEIIGQNFSILCPPERLDEERQMIERIMREERVNTFESVRLSKGGKPISVALTVSPLKDEYGKLIGNSVIAHDISERKLLEAELEHARDAAIESAQLKSEFLANMSHEIRTPMNGVVGMTGLLLATDLNVRQQGYAETIQSSADALLTIIDDILDFSKIEAGLLRFEDIDFDLRVAVETPVEILAERAQAKGLELASLVYRDVPTALQGDPGRLRQVLTNLIGNAVKFTAQGEVVVNVKRVSETASHAMLRFEIKDTGIGISPEAQRRLFRAFTQADGSTTRKYGGTGLGLAISKQLVELMGGEIGIESAQGVGSTFWFTGRFKKQAKQAKTEPKLDTASLQGARVLIVDDNATNREILVHQTSSWGMIASEAESGARALEMLRTAAADDKHFDVALLDLMMPGMDGFKLADAIKSDSLIAQVVLVLLPSYGKSGDGEVARKAGIAAYLQKPVRQSQLYNCLTEIMSSSSASRTVKSSQLGTHGSLRETEVIRKENLVQSSVRILVAEDNLVNQMVALNQLENLGYQAKVVPDGLEVLKELEKEDYDIILMDCQMPGMDGFEATSEIRKREGAARHTTIIAMTANALEGDREKCLAVGMDDYLSKPVRQEALSLKLEQWIKPTNSEAPASEQRAVAASVKQSSLESLPLKRDIPSGVDLSVLNAYRTIRRPGQGDFVTELIDLFLEESDAQLKILREAVSVNDADEIRRVAHLLKGSSGNIGAGRMALLTQELEGKGIEKEEAEALFIALENEFGRVREALEAERIA
jgi:two-component system, sensor histidine kinase and response regulator